MGRLASIVAKELLNGQKIVVVRCEEMEMSNSIRANQVKWKDFLRKRTNTNPRRGPFHEKSPSEIFRRCVRGMIPHKTHRGNAAMKRLWAVEGIPPPYDKVKRKVVPQALRVIRLKPGRQYTNIGEFASLVGWKRRETVKVLEDKRRVKSAAYYEKKKAAMELKKQATEQADFSSVMPTLEKFGYA